VECTYRGRLPEGFSGGLLQLPVVVPTREGVYDLRLSLNGTGSASLERRVQLVVI
jgi:hypothetical protein